MTIKENLIETGRTFFIIAAILACATGVVEWVQALAALLIK